MDSHPVQVQAREAGGGRVETLGPASWRLSLPPGPGGVYRWAQLDDYLALPRGDFPWCPPLRIELRARVSARGLRGTWGFGLWNDPFSLSTGLGGTARRLPALPNAAWFFHASPPNYLSLRDDLPAQGFFAGVFSSPRLPSALAVLGAPAAALLALRPLARLLRRAAARVVWQAAAPLNLDPAAWHVYTLDWQPEATAFSVDGEPALRASRSPRGPLGLVLWIDNQYAAFPPTGQLSFGTLPAEEPAWLELDGLRVLVR